MAIATEMREEAGMSTSETEMLKRLAALNRRALANDGGMALASLTGTFERARDPRSLHRAYGQVYSQNGEDGYIAEIFARIGVGSRFFVEIGVGDGRENTTRLLLGQGWRGLWMEGDPAHCATIRTLFAPYLESGALTLCEAMITRDTVNTLIAGHIGDASIDLLSVDVDYNTSHLWRAIERPARACCIEYNASIPASMAIEVEYDPAGQWDGSNYFGAGLKTMELIGRRKRMALVGCDFQGINAFFVADGEAGEKFHQPFTAEFHHEVPRYQMVPPLGHPRAAAMHRWAAAPPPTEER